MLMDSAHIKFLGLSTIADPEGPILRQMDDAVEGAIIADVTLDPAWKLIVCSRTYERYGDGWVDAGLPNDTVRDLLCSVDAFFGHLSYELSSERRGTARGISSNAAATASAIKR